MSGLPRGSGVSLTAKWLVALLLLAVSAKDLFVPVRDPDFFWHLKTGEWIWEQRSLPDEFLFTASEQRSPAVVQRFAMTSYWAAEVLYHLAYAVGGMGGIVVLRILLFSLLLLLLLRSRKEADDLVLLGLLVLAAIVLSAYPEERPQYFSFVFAAVLLWLLERLRAPGSAASLRWGAAGVPVLMVVWANCHGGFVVGLGLMGIYVLAESIKRLHPALAPLPAERWRLLLAAGGGGFVASLLNPNSWHVFEVAILPAWATEFVTEYRSTIAAFRYGAEDAIIVYWMLLAIVVATLLLTWKKPDLTTIALTAVTGYFSFTQLRYIPFFLVAALPAAARALSTPRLVRPARVAIAAAGLAAGLFYLRDAGEMPGNLSRIAEVDRSRFPVDAADFIQREGLQGNLFNQYEWGGYLLWRLAPAKSFIDGRLTDKGLLDTYNRILVGDFRPVDGRPFWKDHFAKHGIHYTVTTPFNLYNGKVTGLIDVLLTDPGWAPVFVSPPSVVFAEDTPANHQAIRRNALQQGRFYKLLLDSCDPWIAAQPGNPAPYVARGDLLLRLGERPAALRAYEEALRFAPRHPIAKAKADWLRATGVR